MHVLVYLIVYSSVCSFNRSLSFCLLRSINNTDLFCFARAADYVIWGVWWRVLLHHVIWGVWWRVLLHHVIWGVWWRALFDEVLDAMPVRNQYTGVELDDNDVLFSKVVWYSTIFSCFLLYLIFGSSNLS